VAVLVQLASTGNPECRRASGVRSHDGSTKITQHWGLLYLALPERGRTLREAVVFVVQMQPEIAKRNGPRNGMGDEGHKE